MPSGTYARPGALERLMSKVVRTKTCWFWHGAISNHGYGQIYYEGKVIGAHRLSYMLFKELTGLEGLDTDHLCRIRNCVNPEHLEAVTHSENTRRGNKSRARSSDE